MACSNKGDANCKNPKKGWPLTSRALFLLKKYLIHSMSGDSIHPHVRCVQLRAVIVALLPFYGVEISIEEDVMIETSADLEAWKASGLTLIQPHKEMSSKI